MTLTLTEFGDSWVLPFMQGWFQASRQDRSDSVCPWHCPQQIAILPLCLVLSGGCAQFLVPSEQLAWRFLKKKVIASLGKKKLRQNGQLPVNSSCLNKPVSTLCVPPPHLGAASRVRVGFRAGPGIDSEVHTVAGVREPAAPRGAQEGWSLEDQFHPLKLLQSLVWEISLLLFLSQSHDFAVLPSSCCLRQQLIHLYYAGLCLLLFLIFFFFL